MDIVKKELSQLRRLPIDIAAERLSKLIDDAADKYRLEDELTLLRKRLCSRCRRLPLVSAPADCR